MPVLLQASKPLQCKSVMTVMSAALRRVTSHHCVRLSRMCFTLAHPPSTAERAVWQQAAVRPSPRRRHRAELTPFQSGPSPLPFCLQSQLALLHRHAFHQLAQQEKSPPHSTPTNPSMASKLVISNAEQRRRDWAIIRRLAVHIWPKDDWATRGRVVFGVGLLVCGKVRSPSPSTCVPSGD
jgi:hypothetical protein